MSSERRGHKRPRAPSIDDKEVLLWGDDSDDDDIGRTGERELDEDQHADLRLAERKQVGDDDIEGESAQEKRVRLAKSLLRRVQKEELGKIAGQRGSDDNYDDEDEVDGDEARGIVGEKEYNEGEGEIYEDGVILRDAVSMRLQRDLMDASGKLELTVAENLRTLLEKADGEEDDVEEAKSMGVGIFCKRGHSKAATSVALTSDDMTAWTGSKDCTICRWDTETEKKVHVYKSRRTNEGGHSAAILALAVSSDGRYLASGGCDRVVKIWDTRTNTNVETFRGHRDSISSLTFQTYTHTLFSASHDRTIKLWNVTEMSYVDTLFGHQAEVNAIRCLHKEMPVSAGRDTSIRLWKVQNGSQLVFRAPPVMMSIDCVEMIDANYYLSGSQSGHLGMWSVQKKKPVFTESGAHSNRWISSLAVLPSSDVAASGSSDGWMRFWKIDKKARKLDLIGKAPVNGFINSMAFARSGRFVAAAQGQEHRLGKWERISGVVNGLCLVKIGDKWMDNAKDRSVRGILRNESDDEKDFNDEDEDDDVSVPNPTF